RMGIEVQQTAYPPAHWPVNFVVEGNVCYDWNKPYWDSMGLSVPLAGINVTIKSNYIRQNAYKGAWGEPDTSGIVRGSYGIEGPQAPAGQPGGIIEGNTIISERSVMAIAAPGKDTIARNNKLFGPFAWGKIGGEPGSLGFGNVIETNNTHTLDLSKTPPAPPIEIIGGGFTGRTPIPAPTPWPNPNPSPTPNPTRVVGPTQPWDESRFIYLTRYAWTSATNGAGAGPIELNMTAGGAAGGDGRMLSLNDNDYEYGLGVAGNSAIVYQLHGQFAKFVVHVGVDDESGHRAALQFQVWGDGRLLFDSGTVRGRDAARSISIDTKSVQELKLITTSITTKASPANAHGDWANPRLFIDPLVPLQEQQ
ncbi:MAG: NPCBM/NEW2 domain-containing protein, partial [Anaerolineae bacterium]|nr:NPCBM/NEW2 domain-containing protein [Phycisphaerae bacterium]